MPILVDVNRQAAEEPPVGREDRSVASLAQQVAHVLHEHTHNSTRTATATTTTTTTTTAAAAAAAAAAATTLPHGLAQEGIVEQDEALG